MSSPFHSLKKNKVPLFPGHMTGNRAIPFRHPEYSEDECRLLEEITTHMIQERRKRNPFQDLHHAGLTTPQPLPKTPDLSPPSVFPGQGDGKGVPPSDSELMKLMMTKITVLEKQVQSQVDELRIKNRQIKILEDKLRIAEKARQENSNANHLRELETHCLLLQQQIHEMETFLAEYGMVWIGEQVSENANVYLDIDVDEGSSNSLLTESARSDSPDNSNSATLSNPHNVWQQDLSYPGPAGHWSPDFNQLVENIKDLNILAGEGVAQIKKTRDGAKFEMLEPVQLTIYANGILMFDGPFRPYTDPATRQCVRDLLDGYFPSELQDRYPDGVPFIVTDLRGTHYQMKPSPVVFIGQGQTLGGEIKSSRLIAANLQDLSESTSPLPAVGSSHISLTDSVMKEHMATTSQLPGKPMTSASFLNKLPKSVIRNGKVIDIRDSVGETLTGGGGGANAITLIRTSVTKEMSDSMDASTGLAVERPSSYKDHSEVTTLRVVTESGDHTYIVKMKFKETIGDLRTYLDRQVRPMVPYDLVSTFPHKVHRNNTMTLEASGLTPNAVLHKKPHKQ